MLNNLYSHVDDSKNIISVALLVHSCVKALQRQNGKEKRRPYPIKTNVLWKSSIQTHGSTLAGT